MSSNTTSSNTVSSNTIIALVSGAFHHSSVMDILRGHLHEAGFNTFCVTLKSVGKSGISIDDDVTALQTELLGPLVEEQGKDVVMYLHSYAGFPGSAAIRGFSKLKRAVQGKKGGIIGLIYQSAFIPKEGKSLLEMIDGRYNSWSVPDEKTGLVGVRSAMETFYADVPYDLACGALDRLRVQSLITFNTPSGPVYYADESYDGRPVYILTHGDQALDSDHQREFMNRSGVVWHVEELNSSHSPFLSEAVRLATLIQRYAKKFETISEEQELNTFDGTNDWFWAFYRYNAENA